MAIDEAQRAAWLKELNRLQEALDREPEPGEDPDAYSESVEASLRASGDPVLAAAMRILDHFGIWYDPPLSPETALDFVLLVRGEEVPSYWRRVREAQEAARAD